MLELKGMDYELVHVMPGNQRLHLRAAGFRSGTVPALKLDGKKVQGSVAIARELERRNPDPPLYPSDPDMRRRVEQAERWGDEELQDVPRRILRWAMTRDAGLRRWVGETDGAVPAPGITARLTGPVSRYYAWVVRADADHVRRDVAELPSTLDRIDELIDQRVVDPGNPNAATFQILCTVRSLLGFEDFEEVVGARRSAAMARKLYPEYPEQNVPAFVRRLGVA